MSAFPWASLISAGGSLLGGLLGSENNRKANENAYDFAREQFQFQKDAAQQGIRWKVADAKAAGLHPLAALGVSGFSPSPISVSGGGDTALPTALASIGQDVGRAIHSTRTKDEQEAAYLDASRKLSLEKLGAEIELVKSQAARLRQQSMPGLPGAARLITGQGDTPRVGKTFSVSSENPSQGTIVPDVDYASTPAGSVPVPNKDVKERIEDNFFHEAAHFFRNNLLPAFGVNFQAPGPPPPGGKWFYDPFYKGYYLKYKFGPKGQESWMTREEYQKAYGRR